MLHSNVKVSIITPTFNDGEYIIGTLNSILNQTHKNIEVIVIDDCSTDKTVDLILSIKDDRIKLIRNKENMGAAYSRNIGLSVSTGEYIAFLDGDDLWDIDKIEKQLDFMILNNYSFTCCAYKVINEDGEKLNYYVTAPKKISHKKFMRANYIGCLTAMYKKGIFPDLQIPNCIKKRNDYALWLKISERANCYCLDDCLASYRNRKSSISSVKKRCLLKHHIILFKTLYGFNFFVSFIYSLRNVFHYFIRKFLYRKKLNA